MEKLVYLVAVPKGAIYHHGSAIQQTIWEKYNLLENYMPQLHLTLDAFYYEDKEDVDHIHKVLKEIRKELHPFEIVTNGFSYIPEPYNNITIHVIKTKELKEIYTVIHDGMMKRGIQVRAFHPDEMIFHMSITSIFGRSWSTEESQKAWLEVKELPFQYHERIEELELWYPEIEPGKKIISKFNLLDSSITKF